METIITIVMIIYCIIVFFINLQHGWKLSVIAGLKQWIYTFFFGGIIIKLLEIMLVKTKHHHYSTPISVISISILTSLLVFIVHSFRGTPEPFYSTLPTIIMSPPGFIFLANKFKKTKSVILKEEQGKGF